MYQGYSGAILGKELRPLLHLSVVAIEKGTIWSPSTIVANFTYFIIMIIIISHFVSIVIMTISKVIKNYQTYFKISHNYNNHQKFKFKSSLIVICGPH